MMWAIASPSRWAQAAKKRAKALRCGSSSSPTSPRSSSASLSSGVMKMFPGWRSACTKPSSKIILSIVCSPRRATFLGSERVSGVDRILVPAMKVMVRIRSVDSASITSGNTTGGLIRGSCRGIGGCCGPRCGSRAARRSRARTPRRRRPGPGSTRTGSALMTRARRSASPPGRTCRARTTLGRRTLTATTRPSARRALWTCDTDADASGTGANSAKSDAERAAEVASRSCAPRRRTENGPTSSCSSASAPEMYSGMQIGPGTHDLADLDKGGPELAEQIDRHLSQPAPPAIAPRGAARAAAPSRPRTGSTAWPPARAITVARRARRQRGRDFAAIARILYYGDYERTPPPRSLRTHPAARSELRKNDPRTAVGDVAAAGGGHARRGRLPVPRRQRLAAMTFEASGRDGARDRGRAGRARRRPG